MLGVGAERSTATTTSVGSTISTPRSVGLCDVAAHGVELVLLEQARADLVALRREEGEQHPAADEEPVDARKQVRDDAELVADLRAAEHDRVRPLRVLGEAVEHVELGRDQQAGRGRQELGELVDARLLAVHDTEAVRDEHVAELGELLRRTRGARASSFAVSPGLKRRFSMTATSPSSSAATASCADSPTVSRANATGLPSSSESRWATGARLYFASGAPSGRPRCEHTTTRAPCVDEGVEGGKRRPHAAIVRDDAVLQGDVQVTTDDDALAGERTQRVEGAQSHDDRAQRRSATYSVRSTRRLE